MSIQRFGPRVVRGLCVVFLGMAISGGDAVCSGAGAPVPPWPYDGAAHVDPEGLVLYWWAASGAKSYDVYLGQSADGLVVQGSATQPQWTIRTPLAKGKLYFWRVIARANSAVVATGPVRRFTVSPPPSTDASLVAWYAFDEGFGGVSRNLAGGGPDAQVERMTWGTAAAPGLDGASVQSDGVGWIHFQIPAAAVPPSAMTLSGWFRVRPQNGPAVLWSLGSGPGSYVSLVAHPAHGGCPFIEVLNAGRSLPITSQGASPLPLDRWTHLAVVMDTRTQQIAVYEDGAVTWIAKGLAGLTGILAQAVDVYLGTSFVSDPCLRGGMDDIRLYTRALSASEVARTVLGHPDSPYEPDPRQWAQVHVSLPALLRWQGTPAAVRYNLYTGTAPDSLSLAARDLTKAEHLLTPAPAGGQTLYWQVEAVLANGFVRSPAWQYSVTSQSLAEVVALATPEWWRAAFEPYYRQIAPEMSLTDIEGAGHRLRDYRGRHLLVVVWRPDCRVSRDEMTELSHLWKTVSEEEVAFLTIIDESKRAFLPGLLAERPDIMFPVCVAKLSSLPAPFGSVLNYPSILYLAPDGTIKLGTVGWVPRAEIERILAAAWPRE